MNFRYGLISLLMLFTIYSNSFSQPHIEWQKSLGGSFYDVAKSIQQTSDGGFIIAGDSKSNDGDVTGHHGSSNFTDDFWIVKLNSIGSILWQKSFGGNQTDDAQSIKQTIDGGYIVAGFTYSNDGDVIENHGSRDCWILKLDINGDIIWKKSFGSSGEDGAYSIQQTLDGGYIVAGISYSNDGDVIGNHGDMDYWIIKLNSNGEIKWQKSLGGSLSDIAYSINQTSDGGYIVAGDSYSNDYDVTGNHGGKDYWVVKLDSNGVSEWQKSLGGSEAELASSVLQTYDGGFIVAGGSWSNDGDVTGNHGGGDYWIVKLDIRGSIQWQKSIGGSSNDYASSIQQTSDGGFVVAGFTQSNDGDILGNHGGIDCWIVKLNSLGNIQWQKVFGGFDYDDANSIQLTSDGGFIFAGYSGSNNGDVTGHHGLASFYDVWIVKLSPDITDIKEKTNPNNNELSIYPNPASDNISISFTEGNNQSIHIYNSFGFEIIRFEGKDLFAKNSININVEDFPSGVYYVSQDFGCLADIRSLTKSFIVIR